MNFGEPRPEINVPRWENGRVTGLSNKSFESLPMTTEDHNQNNEFQFQALQGILEHTTLSALFFSKENMKILQDRIRYEVWLRSGKKHIISLQSTIDLEIVMRSIFLQYALHLNDRYREQILRLDDLVVEWCVQKILVELLQHISYLDAIQANPVPLDLPQNLSSTGTKMLRSITTTF